MLGEPNPPAHWEELFDGADASGDIERFPPFDRVLEECRSVRASTLSRLASLSEEDLDRASVNVPDGVEELFGTYRRCLQCAADHWYMHPGAPGRCAPCGGGRAALVPGGDGEGPSPFRTSRPRVRTARAERPVLACGVARVAFRRPA